MLWVISIFKWVLYSTALASVLSLIIILFKLLFKEKLGVRWHYAIWLIVIIRLIIPYGPQSSLSIFNLFKLSDKNVTQITNPLNNETTKNIQNYNKEKLVVNNESRFIINNKNINKTVIGKENITVSNDKTNLLNNIAQDKTNDSSMYLQLISCMWLLGVIILGCYTILMTVKLKIKLKNEYICENEEVMRLLSQCKNKLNLKSNIKIINTNVVKIPCIFGLIKPKLLLPIGIGNYVTTDELEFIILHELAHVKRKDILISCIAGMLQIIHWFNPIIWYSFYRMRNDKELACDALALSYVDSDDYINYGKTIIKLLESYKKTTSVYGMACIINDKSQIKRRVTMISLFKKNSYKWSIIPVVALTLMGGVMLTNAKNNPVLADNKNNQNLKASKTLSDKSKTNSIANAITEYNVESKHFKGKILIIPNPEKIVIGVNKDISKVSKTTSQIAKENKAICAINAGGFSDFKGELAPVGLIIHNGTFVYSDLKSKTNKIDTVGFTSGGKLIVGRHSSNELKKLNVKEAVSFGPALIVNGKPTIKKGNGNWGMAPRTAIGQKKDGSVIMLTIDGRSIKSIGATLRDVQNILLKHGAYNASNLDGGSSSTMYYNGKVINNPSDSKGERKVVSTFMVLQ